MTTLSTPPPVRLWAPIEDSAPPQAVPVLSPETPIESADLVAMRLTDVVVDPIVGSVTHLVVTPPGPHQIPRLVPRTLVRSTAEGLRISLADRGVRSLPRVLPIQFLRGPCENMATDMDVRFRTVLLHPYVLDTAPARAHGTVGGIDALDCELRRGDDVVTRDDRSLGQVRALLARQGRVTALVVGSRFAGRSAAATVPVELVGQHLPGMIILTADRDDVLKRESALRSDLRRAASPNGDDRRRRRYDHT